MGVDGKIDGTAVGCIDGFCVGLFEGMIVGMFVGISVGDSVGATVGKFGTAGPGDRTAEEVVHSEVLRPVGL